MHYVPVLPAVPRSRVWQCVIAIVLGLAIFFTAAPADAQSAAVRYERALAREKAARAMTGTSVVTLRAIARSYEAIVHAYPRSGYADNALWQGAGLLQLAYERGGSVSDLQSARRLLTWLKREYPTAPLAKQVTARLAALNAPRKPAATATAKRSTPSTPASAPAAATPPRPAATPAPEPAPIPTAPKSLPIPVAEAREAASPPRPRPQPVPLPLPRATPPAPSVPAPVGETIDDEAADADEPERPAGPAAVVVATTPDVPVRAPSSDAVPAVWEAPAAPRVEALAALPAPPVDAMPPSETAVPVRDITHSTLPRGDRITIELGRESAYVANRAGSPDRFEIELNDAALAAALRDKLSTISGATIRSLSATRVGQSAARVVLELNGTPRISTFPLYNPFRLVVDVEADPATATAAAPATPAPMPSTSVGAAAKPPVPTPPSPAKPEATIDDPLPAPVTPSSTSRGDYSLARQLGLSVSRIVIDPGHGGHDPGARANGVNEADIVLDVALRLEALLKSQPGIDVVLTRRTNVFIPLEERTAIANRESADMFLSIHVNASPRPMTRGIETYLLDFASNSDAESLAARENSTSAQSMRVLPDLVKAIALNNKVDESRELARMVQASLVARITPLSKTIKDFGVKRAPFVVLIGAAMPSVLAEISFLTNRTDAALMKQASHRQRIAQALADAIIRYRASLKGAASSSNQTARQQ